MRKFIAVSLTVVLALCLFCACTPSKRIVGEWKTTKDLLGVVSTETTYIFKVDGTGTQHTVVDIPFTYTIDGDKLTIKTNVVGIDITTTEYTFKFVGKKLQLISGDEILILEKAD